MIILTGGAGFIGSNVLAALNAAGRRDVLVVDSLGTGDKWKNLVGRSFLDIVSKQEFRDRMALEEFDGVEAVIHMGACSATTERNADYLLDNNFRYSVDVAEFAMTVGARFIYASSAATYGNGSRGYSDNTTDLQPLNMYGYSKHLFDDWIRRNGYEQNCVGLKFFNVFGPNEEHKADMRSMVSKSYRQIMQTGRVSLFRSSHPDYADGGQMRDFIYVKDCCSVILELLGNPSINGLYNLGTGVPRTWNDLVAAVFAALQVPCAIDYVDMPATLVGQYQNYTCASVDKLTSALPRATFTPLEDAIADYVSNYLSKEWSNL
jgi:ADP-L-glycero-D-manno-heptose 6-epimerase